NLLLMAALAWAWLRRSSPLAGRRLRQALLAALGLAILLALAARARHGFAPMAVVEAMAALALFGILCRISLTEPFHPANRIYRLAVTAVGLFALVRARGGTGPFFLFLAITRFPWARVLTTSELFAASAGALVVFVVLLLVPGPQPYLAGPLDH